MLGRGTGVVAAAWIGLWAILSGCGGGSSDATGAGGLPAIDGGDASQTGGSGGSSPGGNSGSGGSTDAPGSGASGGSVGAAGTGGSSGSAGITGSGGSTAGDSGQCTPAGDGASCRPTPYPDRSRQLDIYIMFDQTGSTCTCIDPVDAGVDCTTGGCATTRIEALREAATAFLQDSASLGIGVGIGYFGHLPIGQASCDPADYDDPAVGIAELPGNASAIIQSMNSVEPTGETPTGPAIRGACSYTRRWKMTHSEREAVILLLTDGRPEAAVTCAATGACCPTLPDAVAAANECFTGNPTVRTYVLGVGPLLSDLQQLAVAGGTQRAYLVESTDVSRQVLEALRAIRATASRCELELPKTAGGQVIDPKLLNLHYEMSPCDFRLIPRVTSLGDCRGAAGWFYDNPSNPTRVHLCPASCDQLSDPRIRLTFSAGCPLPVDSG